MNVHICYWAMEHRALPWPTLVDGSLKIFTALLKSCLILYLTRRYFQETCCAGVFWTVTKYDLVFYTIISMLGPLQLSFPSSSFNILYPSWLSLWHFGPLLSSNLWPSLLPRHANTVGYDMAYWTWTDVVSHPIISLRKKSSVPLITTSWNNLLCHNQFCRRVWTLLDVHPELKALQYHSFSISLNSSTRCSSQSSCLQNRIIFRLDNIMNRLSYQDVQCSHSYFCIWPENR